MFDNAISVLNVILHVFWEVIGSLEIERLIIELEVVIVHELVPRSRVTLLSHRHISLLSKNLSSADLAVTIVAFQVEIVRHGVWRISHVQRQLFMTAPMCDHLFRLVSVAAQALKLVLAKLRLFRKLFARSHRRTAAEFLAVA